MAAGDEKSAIPFERNASIAVRGDAAKSTSKSTTKSAANSASGASGNVGAQRQGFAAFCRHTKAITHALRWTKSANSVMESQLPTGTQSPQWRTIQRPFSWQG